MSAIDKAALVAAIERLKAAADRDFAALNEADGALGDGDLGITLQRGMQLVSEKTVELPDDLGMALMQCAQAFTKSSGSSYGTLTATGLMAMAKALKGETRAEASRASELVGAARDAMQSRGKAELGGKTVLDSLDAVAKGTAGKEEAGAVADAAARAVDEALDAFRGERATVGRGADVRGQDRRHGRSGDARDADDREGAGGPGGVSARTGTEPAAIRPVLVRHDRTHPSRDTTDSNHRGAERRCGGTYGERAPVSVRVVRRQSSTIAVESPRAAVSRRRSFVQSAVQSLSWAHARCRASGVRNPKRALSTAA